MQWGCSLPLASVRVLVGIVSGGLLVGGDAAMLVGVCSCVIVLVNIGDGVPLVGGGVATSVGSGILVGSTVLMLLVVLGPVEVYNIHMEQFAYKVCYS